jgi:hypothetical protein
MPNLAEWFALLVVLAIVSPSYFPLLWNFVVIVVSCWVTDIACEKSFFTAMIVVILGACALWFVVMMLQYLRDWYAGL